MLVSTLPDNIFKEILSRYAREGEIRVGSCVDALLTFRYNGVKKFFLYTELILVATSTGNSPIRASLTVALGLYLYYILNYLS